MEKLSFFFSIFRKVQLSCSVKEKDRPIDPTLKLWDLVHCCRGRNRDSIFFTAFSINTVFMSLFGDFCFLSEFYKLIFA